MKEGTKETMKKGYNPSRSGKRARMLAGQRKRERIDMRNSRTFGYGYALLTGVAVFVVLIVAFSLFFNVADIRVSGNERYSDEEIVAASKLEEGDNLYLFNKYGKIETMFDALPYLSKVQIRREMPDTIVITVEETEARFELITEKGVLLLAADGKILELLPEKETLPGVSRIYGYGLEPGAEMVGQNIADLEDEKSRVAAFLELVAALDKAGNLEKLGDVDMTEAYDVQFIYEGRFLVSTGMPEKLEEKAVYLDEVVRKLNVTDVGYIELGGEQLRFIPAETAPTLNTEERNIEVESEPGQQSTEETGLPAETEAETENGSEAESETESEPAESGSESD